jgi:hypothetical protein
MMFLKLKWSTNRFMPFISIDAHIDENPRPRDPEGNSLIHLKLL